MAWWKGTRRYRSAAIVIGVTIAHAGAISLTVSYVFKAPSVFEPVALEIELAELELPAIELEPAVEPERVAPAETGVNEAPQAAQERPPMEALTQLETAATAELRAPELSSQKPPSNTVSDKANTASLAQIASILEQANCGKLKRRDETDCDPPDPFAVAASNAARQGEPLEQAPDSPFAEVGRQDRLAFQVGAETFKKFGMTGDLFVDPMAPGAYNARRIRNGQEPLWSQEMRDGFRKSE